MSSPIDSVEDLNTKFKSLRGRIVEFYSQNHAKLLTLAQHFKYVWLPHFSFGTRTDNENSFLLECLKGFGSIYDMSLLRQLAGMPINGKLERFLPELIKRREAIAENVLVDHANIVADVSVEPSAEMNNHFTEVFVKLRLDRPASMQVLDAFKRDLAQYTGLGVHCLQLVRAAQDLSSGSTLLELHFYIPKLLSVQFLNQCHSKFPFVFEYAHLEQLRMDDITIAISHALYITELEKVKENVRKKAISFDAKNYVVNFEDAEGFLNEAIANIRLASSGCSPSVTFTNGFDLSHNEHIPSLEGSVSSREGMQAGREGMQAGREGMQAGREGMQAGREGMQAGREGMQAGREGMQAGREGMQAGREGMQNGNEKSKVGGGMPVLEDDTRTKRNSVRSGHVQAQSQSNQEPTSNMDLNSKPKPESGQDPSPTKNGNIRLFAAITDIPPALVKDVIQSYQKGELICRNCYYSKKGIMTAKPNWKCFQCKDSNSVPFIRASPLCNSYASKVAILPTPKDDPDLPFSMCAEAEHYSCFELMAKHDLYYAHSVEELVIWNMEYHYKCTFKEFIKLWNNEEPNSAKFVEAQTKKTVSSEKGKEQSSSPKTSKKAIGSKGSKSVSAPVAVKYDPKKTKFPHACNIPEELLDDVISCFNKKEVVCRKCFYENGKRSMFVKLPRGGGDVCQNCKIMVPPLVPLIVIPASERCVSNLPCSGWVALPPRPTDRSTYEYCGKGGTHSRCFSYLYRNLWFTHTVEELVVWTIERDTGLTFSQFVQQYKERSLESLIEGRRNRGSLSRTVPKGNPPEVDAKYIPEEIHYRSMADIPIKLLMSVIDCYRKYKLACKRCFYVDKMIVERQDAACPRCKKPFEPLHVIPCSNLCKYYFGTHIALPPYPRGGPEHKVFEYCQKGDHQRCFRVYYEEGFWYSHSVEEVVVWTVERELQIPFDEFVKQFDE